MSAYLNTNTESKMTLEEFTLRTEMALTRVETHLRRIYRYSHDGIVEGECSAALSGLAIDRKDLGFAKHPMDNSSD
jgi:hypothetical protein